MRMDERLANAARPTLALGLLLLSACNAGPDYRPPSVSDLKIPDQFQASSTIAAEQDMVDLARWWDSFEDPVLTQLIDRAFAGNLDVSAAAARLRQARATLRGTRGQALPTVGASGSVTRRTIHRSR